MRTKKIALLCTAGAPLMNAVPCYAASQTMVSASSSANNYAQTPDAETLKKDVGFEPKMPEMLVGGFKFSSGAIIETYNGDVSSPAANKRMGISFKYMSDEDTTKTVSFSAEPYDGQSVKENASASTYDDIELYYSTQYANYLGWFQDDIHCSLMDVSRGITKDEMTAMVKEITNMETNAVNEK